MTDILSLRKDILIKEAPAKQDKLSHESGPVFLKMWQNYFRIDENGNSPISVFHKDCFSLASEAHIQMHIHNDKA